MRRRGIVCFALALPLFAACGGREASPSPGDGGLGVCVEDSRKPAGCQSKWTLVDPCNLAASAAVLEAAVFDKQCPPDSVLSAGDLSLAMQRQSVKPDQPIIPEQGLEQQPYGFAFLLRDVDCHVILWGCTEADLGAVTEIRTSVRNWSAPNPSDMCIPATGGGCTASATCNAGKCQ
jgi:hypothetical protein